MKKQVSRTLIGIVMIVAVFLIIWSISLIKCELLTKSYCDAFATEHQSNEWISDATYFKVLKCDGETSEVYYVSDELGAVLEFRNQNGTWEETTWRTVWAKHGSASETVWPYWWHGIFSLP